MRDEPYCVIHALHLHESILFCSTRGDYCIEKHAEKTLPSRISVAIRVSMAGVGGIGRLPLGGTGFLAISGTYYFEP